MKKNLLNKNFFTFFQLSFFPIKFILFSCNKFELYILLLKIKKKNVFRDIFICFLTFNKNSI